MVRKVVLVEGDVYQRSEDCIEITTQVPLYPDGDGDHSEELEEMWGHIAIETFGPCEYELDERDPHTMWIWKK